MHYIIQENVFRESHYDVLRKTLERLKLPFTTVRIFPFVEKITALEDIPDGPYNVDDLPEFVPSTNRVFVFGAIKLARIVRKRGWKPGSMMNDNHDYLVYREHYRENLLNWDSQIFKTVDDFGWKDEEVKFIRPTQDTKSFTGKVFTKIEWQDFIENQLYNYKSEIFNEETLVQVSSPKNIQKEIRFWVVGGRVVTGSQYRLGNQTIYSDYFEEEAREFAQRMVDKFQLAEAFVIDVCLANDEWKIVECGCINCAGFYKADLPKAVEAIENHFDFQDSYGPAIDGSKSLGY
jgi:hypothetical protein